MQQAIKYIYAKNISRKAHFSSKTMFIGKKYFKIFERVLLWPTFIPDTPFRAKRHGLHRFLNGLQMSYKRLWRNCDVTDIVRKKMFKEIKSGHKTLSEYTFCCAYNLFVTNFERFTNGKPLDIKEIFFYLFFIKQL